MKGIIPEPASLKMMGENFEINKETRILSSKTNQDIAQKLRDFIKWFSDDTINLETQIHSSTENADNSNSNCIVISISSELSDLGKEGYELNIQSDLIKIQSAFPNGLFYGTISLRQIIAGLEKESVSRGIYTIPCLSIRDYPRFSWRGYMLDEARFFLGKESVKKILDNLALLKINKFHWHLTEDQGWRIQIDKYPKLVEIGSKRKGTPKYRNINKTLDGISHAGYYTKSDIKEIIQYASERFIEIIPEIEMPGHATAALAAYPELSCTGGPFEVSPFWGVHTEVFCAGKEKTISFLKDVLDEVCELFPSEYIHIGGDEVRKNRWKNCADCQKKIKENNLKDEHDLQVNFTNEIESHLLSKGKRAICWNEVVDPKLDKNIVCQYWTGKVENVIPFLEENGNVIISPSRNYYVDLTYFATPLKKTYEYEPIPKSLSNSAKDNILGIEAEMWGEVFKSIEKVEWCTFPRILAVAESAWTLPENKEYNAFRFKVESYFGILDKLGVNHALMEESDPKKIDKLKARFKKGFGHFA